MTALPLSRCRFAAAGDGLVLVSTAVVDVGSGDGVRADDVEDGVVASAVVDAGAGGAGVTGVEGAAGYVAVVGGDAAGVDWSSPSRALSPIQAAAARTATPAHCRAVTGRPWAAQSGTR